MCSDFTQQLKHKSHARENAEGPGSRLWARPGVRESPGDNSTAKIRRTQSQADRGGGDIDQAEGIACGKHTIQPDGYQFQAEHVCVCVQAHTRAYMYTQVHVDMCYGLDIKPHPKIYMLKALGGGKTIGRRV